MSKSHLRALRLFLRFRVRPPTVLGLVWINRWLYGLTAVLFAAIAWYFYSRFGEVAASYIGVAFAAIILRDIGHFRRTVALWPVYQAIIDWEKAGQFADADARQPTPLP